MYQSRIHKWKFDKKLKAPEVAYALRMVDSRRGMGKETEIRIRGVIFPEERLRKYVERSKVVPDEEALTTSAVVAYTPPPKEHRLYINSDTTSSTASTPTRPTTCLSDGDQITMHGDSQPPPNRKRPRSSPSGEDLLVRNSRSIHLWPEFQNPSPRSLGPSASMPSLHEATLPPPARSASQALAHIDRYYEDYFESHLWTTWAADQAAIDEQQQSDLLSADSAQYLGIFSGPPGQGDPAFIVHRVEIACQLFRAGRYALARRRLDQANSQVKTLLLEQAPLLLGCLLSVVSLLEFLSKTTQMDHDGPDPMRLFLEFVSEMAETKLGVNNPITRLFSSLVELQTGHLAIGQLALQRILEIFRNKVGIMHIQTYRLAYHCTWVLIWRRQFDEARAVLEQFLDNIKHWTTRDTAQSRACRYLLAQIYIALHKYSGAEWYFREIIERAKEGLGEERAQLVTFEAWRMLAVIADFQQRLDERSKWEEEALECGELTLGPQDPRVVRLQRVISSLEPRAAPEKQWRFIPSFPPIGDEATVLTLSTKNL
jgi:tetratricopeptide (TPR) repeat protein